MFADTIQTTDSVPNALLNAYQSVNFPRDPTEGKNFLGPDAAAVMVDVLGFAVDALVPAAVDVSGVLSRCSRSSVFLGVGGAQDGEVGNLDKVSGGGLPDEAVPA